MVGVLAGATAYEAALALGAGTIGPAPGDGVAGDDWVRLAAIAAMLLGVVLAFGNRGLTLEFAPVAAAAFVVASFYTYDPYFAPSLRRYSDNGVVPTWWIAVVAAVAVTNSAVSLRVGSGRRILTAAVLLLCLFTGALAVDGH